MNIAKLGGALSAAALLALAGGAWAQVKVRLEPLVTGINTPLAMVQAPGDGRMFIIEQSIRFDTWIPYFALPVGYFLAAAVAASRVVLALAGLRGGLVAAVRRASGYFAEREGG